MFFFFFPQIETQIHTHHTNEPKISNTTRTYAENTIDMSNRTPSRRQVVCCRVLGVFYSLGSEKTIPAQKQLHEGSHWENVQHLTCECETAEGKEREREKNYVERVADTASELRLLAIR